MFLKANRIKMAHCSAIHGPRQPNDLGLSKLAGKPISMWVVNSPLSRCVAFRDRFGALCDTEKTPMGLAIGVTYQAARATLNRNLNEEGRRKNEEVKAG